MKKTSSPCCSSCADSPKAGNERRKFLQGAAVAAGGLVLGLQSVASADQETKQEPEPQAAPVAPAGVQERPDSAETLLALPAKVLESVGGYDIVETATDKVIVVRTGPTSIVACSAICTHKGCLVEYVHERQQFVCPCHNARFELTGKVVKGPAKRDLKAYVTRPVLGLSVPDKTPVPE